MKKKDIKEMAEKPNLELQKELLETKEELRKAQFDLEANKLQNVRAPKELRKKIARLKTFMKQHGG